MNILIFWLSLYEIRSKYGNQIGKVNLKYDAIKRSTLHTILYDIYNISWPPEMLPSSTCILRMWLINDTFKYNTRCLYLNTIITANNNLILIYEMTVNLRLNIGVNKASCYWQVTYNWRPRRGLVKFLVWLLVEITK